MGISEVVSPITRKGSKVDSDQPLSPPIPAVEVQSSMMPCRRPSFAPPALRTKKSRLSLLELRRKSQFMLRQWQISYSGSARLGLQKDNLRSRCF